MKTTDTLVEDIQKVIAGNGGWDDTIAKSFLEAMEKLMDSRLNQPQRSGPGTVRMSNVGQPCARKLWYHVHAASGEPLASSARLKFLYGDVIEELLLSLAEAAGHTVVGQQDEARVAGILGHRDGVIDGMLVDVKSASTFGFKKFKEHQLRGDDPFGYIPQLATYLLAAQDDPLVTNKKEAAFLVMDKQHGHLCLDKYNLEKEMAVMPELIKARVKLSAESTPPNRGFNDVPYGKSGNKSLPVNCSYCEYKKNCWPGLRTFIYSRGPVFLTEVKDLPRVPEVK